MAFLLQTTPENILGLAIYESGGDNGDLIKAGTNNYFGLTAGGPAFKAWSTGEYLTFDNGDTHWYYPSSIPFGSGLITSGMSFAESYMGARVFGTTSPTAFATALNQGNKFN